jgi:hypothetical protein
MPRYHINCLDGADRVGRKFFIWGEDDDGAVRLARKLHHPHRVEIVRNGVVVAVLEGERALNLQ